MKTRKNQAQNSSLLPKKQYKNNRNNNKDNNNQILTNSNNSAKRYTNQVNLLYFTNWTRTSYKRTSKSGTINLIRILLVQFQVIIWIRWLIIKIFKIRLELPINRLISLLNSVKLEKLFKKTERLKNNWLILMFKNDQLSYLR